MSWKKPARRGSRERSGTTEVPTLRRDPVTGAYRPG
jgi:hypothetical protein